VTVRILEHSPHGSLVLLVVDPIADDRIFRTSVLIRHSLRWLLPSIVLELSRSIPIEPLEVLLTRVCLVTKAIAELVTEGETEHSQPLVVLKALSGPNGARVLRIVNRHVATGLRLIFARGRRVESRFRTGRCSQHPMSRIQELCRLQNHLHYMLVAVPTGTPCRIRMKEEDIHGVGTGAGVSLEESLQFY